MKENFNTARVNNKVTNLLTLSSTDLHLQKQLLCTDFAQWMKEHFNLEQEQIKQLGLAISNSLSVGQPIQFLKENKGEEMDWNELAVQGLEEWQEPLITRQFRSPLFIAIRYRKSP